MRRIIIVFMVLGVLTGILVLAAGCGGGGGGGDGLPDLPETPGSIGGGVQDGTLMVTALDRHSGSAVIGANVYVAYGTSAFHLPTTSTGTAVFAGLSPGPVTVTIIATNYIPITIINIDAAAVTIPLNATSISRVNRNVTSSGLTPSFIGGRELLTWSNLGGGFDYSVIDDGSGNAVTDSNPIVISLVEDWPLAIASFVFDPPEDPDNILQAYIEYPSGPPSGSIVLNHTSASMKQVSGTLSVPSSFDLMSTDVSVNVIALAYLKALGDLFVGDIIDPIVTDSSTAVFNTSAGNDLRVARIPRDEEYSYIAILMDSRVVDQDRGSAHVVRGSYDSLGTTVNFDDFKATATSVNVSTGDLTPTISWSNTDAPGSSGGYYLVALGSQGSADALDWTLMADGATTAVTIPDYVGEALANSTDYAALVGAIYIPSFDFNSFTYADVEAGYTHQTSKELNFTTP